VAVYGRNDTATLIIYSTTPLATGQNGLVTVAGTISAVGEDVLTVTQQDGTLVTVELTPATVYRYRGRLLSTPPGLNPGLTVRVMGTRQADGSVVARRLVIT
jgi:hypothetical protein